MKPDPEYLVALALCGVLPPEQTMEILAAVRFKGSRTMTELRWENTLNKVCDAVRERIKTT